MNVLIIGNGGREHAIAWKINQSPLLDNLFCLPGNAGTESLATNLTNIDIAHHQSIIDAVQANTIDLVIIGPEQPLADGLADSLNANNVKVFGPTATGAKLEASKSFSKSFMKDSGLPTSNFDIFSDIDSALNFINKNESSITDYVIKADGLAAGKGVILPNNIDEATRAINQIMSDKIFGNAGDKLIIEKRIPGKEVSAHAFSDGKNIIPMPFVCDHKPVFDGNKGPNTGGMGCFSPPQWLSEQLQRTINQDISAKTIESLSKINIDYKGVLYPGLMIDGQDINILEYNCRFGDPETQILMSKLQSDLLEICLAAADKKLDQINIKWDQRPTVGVILASGGYPGDYDTGHKITGLADIDDDINVFFAGVKRKDNMLITSGGRVMAVVGSGNTLNEAREKTYKNVSRIKFANMHYRTDIGLI
ncbi:MAG: phosphoribosylamine--glycine ligase [Dehalococcoidia bacterium]|nr:phosphoribosylamine--glycine ligase [Dehalococcoidia bacterium]